MMFQAFSWNLHNATFFHLYISSHSETLQPPGPGEVLLSALFSALVLVQLDMNTSETQGGREVIRRERSTPTLLNDVFNSSIKIAPLQKG